MRYISFGLRRDEMDEINIGIVGTVFMVKIHAFAFLGAIAGGGPDFVKLGKFRRMRR